jgi:hypothetical protein
MTAATVAKELQCSRSYVYELEGNYTGHGVIPSQGLAARIQEKTKIPAAAWEALSKCCAKCWRKAHPGKSMCSKCLKDAA